MYYNKSYGQHILTSDSIAESMVDERGIDISKNDTVLEIGPGTGMLTKHILNAHAQRVIAIEKDPAMVAHLKKMFEKEIASGQLVLHQEDALTYDPKQDGLTEGSYLFAGNLPYYITGALLRRYLSAVATPSSMVVMVQREVAERIVDMRSGSILSMSIVAYGTPTLARIVKPGSFVPPPDVDSAILTIADISKKRFIEHGVSEKFFFEVLKEGFKEKRKQLKNNLKNIVGSEEEDSALFAKCGIAERARAEDLDIDGWFCLAEHLSQQS